MKHPVRIAPCLLAGRLDVEGAEGRVVRCAPVPGGSLLEDHIPDETGFAEEVVAESQVRFGGATDIAAGRSAGVIPGTGRHEAGCPHRTAGARRVETTQRGIARLVSFPQ